MADHLFPRPFIKWAGGKSRLAAELLGRMPERFGAYHEPFVGSGALFFRLVRRGWTGRAYLSDLNAELIDAYVAIRDRVDDVVELLSRLEYDAGLYYTLRAADPRQLPLPERAARMIYLNKSGYNGLYRVNRRGQFNVPFGRYKAPNYCDRSNLAAVSRALQDVDLACAPFECVLERARAGDWVYFDPPYAPLSRTANFTGYQANGFTAEDQRRLRDVGAELALRGVSVMVSNSDTELVRSLYAPPTFALDRVLAQRAINSNGARRGKITELIVTSYPIPVPT
jgi:DNA adenine methylase